MPSRKYTLRLPPPLEATVDAHLAATGLPFADLARAALSAYLSASLSAEEPTAAPIPADILADSLNTMQTALEALTVRVQALEQQRTPPRTRADRSGQAQPYDPTQHVLGTLCLRGHVSRVSGNSNASGGPGSASSRQEASKHEDRQEGHAELWAGATGGLWAVYAFR